MSFHALIAVSRQSFANASSQPFSVSAAAASAAAEVALAPFATDTGENPYTLHQGLQQTMNDLVGIIRTRSELEESLREIEAFKERARTMVVEGHRQYNPGWHLAIDLTNMLIVSECIAKAALEREESRGGHTREDFPGPNEDWGKVNLVLTLAGGDAPASIARIRSIESR